MINDGVLRNIKYISCLLLGVVRMPIVRILFFFAIGIYSHWALAALPIQNWKTSTGARVYFIENHDLPILDVSIEFNAGSSLDSPQKSGQASLTQHLLDLGAGGLSEEKIAKLLADTGAQLDSHFDLDRAGLSLRTLSSRPERKQALDIFARIIQKPVFPEKIIAREKSRYIARLKEASMQPDFIADRTLMEMLYGSHPYGLNESGEIDTLSTLKREDLIAFYQSYYVSQNAVVALIGDLSRAEAEAIAESLTKDLPSTGSAKKVLPPVQIPTAQLKKITHPATQSHIQLAYPGITRSDPDYFPLLVGNHILGGGGFTSRLMEEIRQLRGLAYSVYSYFSPFKEQGPFQIGLQTKKEQADEALKITQDVLRKFVAEGPSEKELLDAKQNIIGGFPLRIDSNKKILRYLAMIGFYQLPLSYIEDYLQSVENVTALQIKQAYQRRINPDGMVTVIVGATE